MRAKQLGKEIIIGGDSSGASELMVEGEIFDNVVQKLNLDR